MFRFMPEIVQIRISARFLAEVRTGTPIIPALHLLLDDPSEPDPLGDPMLQQSRFHQRL